MVRLAALCLALSFPAAAQDRRLEQVFERVDPAVVTIRVALKTLLSTEEAYRLEVGIGTGSGVLLHQAGFIVTAAHVVEDAELIEVEFKDGSKVEASIVTLSRTEDLALLKVDTVPKGVVAPVLADSDLLKVGQSVFTIGTPFGYAHTLSSGVVSSIRNQPPKGLVPGRVIQTDTAFNHGNSGGPLFNEKGEVVGIDSYIASSSGGSEGLGFAVPSNVVRRRLFEQPIPYIGVSLRLLNNQVMELFNWPYAAGMLVEKVRPGSVAEKAGLKGGVVDASVGGIAVKLGGDLVVKVGEFDATQTDKIGEYLSGLKADQTVKYVVMRAGKLYDLEVTVPYRDPVPKLAGGPALKKK